MHGDKARRAETLFLTIFGSAQAEANARIDFDHLSRQMNHGTKKPLILQMRA